MDYLQYLATSKLAVAVFTSVLNLIINGLPSIQNGVIFRNSREVFGFKPYYKWITFNTSERVVNKHVQEVLNLIINGLPSIRKNRR